MSSNTATLTINGQQAAEIVSYRQDREHKEWTFTTATGETIRIPWARIKIFRSCPALSIITF
jgi:hypothetical protein